MCPGENDALKLQMRVQESRSLVEQQTFDLPNFLLGAGEPSLTEAGSRWRSERWGPVDLQRDRIWSGDSWGCKNRMGMYPASDTCPLPSASLCPRFLLQNISSQGRICFSPVLSQGLEGVSSAQVSLQWLRKEPRYKPRWSQQQPGWDRTTL